MSGRSWSPRAHATLARAALMLALSPGTALATYSINAFDATTGELGGAGASCVPYAVDLIYGVAAGKGVLNAQARYDESAKLYGVELLAAGASAEQTLAAVTDPALFPKRDAMQWGIADTRGGLVAFTGAEAGAYAGHLTRRSSDGRFAYSVQGNILTSSRVLEQMQGGFETPGCDLAERLMRALEAAGVGGEGDSRCTPEGRPANSAYLNVTAPSGVRVHLSVPDVSPSDPTRELRALYDAFRKEQSCPPASAPMAAPSSVREGARGGCQITSGSGEHGSLALLTVWLAVCVLIRRSRVAHQSPLSLLGTARRKLLAQRQPSRCVVRQAMRVRWRRRRAPRTRTCGPSGSSCRAPTVPS